MPTDLERITALEVKVEDMGPDIKEMKQDIKTILAYHNQQKGRAKILALIWTGVVTGLGALADHALGKH